MGVKTIILVIVIIILIIGFVYFVGNKSLQNKQEQIQTKNMIKITSLAFSQNGIIPQKYTCKGENINPPLKIEGVPESIKSLVLIVDEPDAPKETFTHWIVLNIDPKTTEINENSVPGTEGINDFKKGSYGGPCPPSGTHRYFFKLYALDTTLEFKKAPSKSELEFAMQGHIIDQAQLIGLFSK